MDLKQWCSNNLLNSFGKLNSIKCREQWFLKNDHTNIYEHLIKINPSITIAVKTILDILPKETTCYCGNPVIFPKKYCSVSCGNNCPARAKRISDTWKNGKSQEKRKDTMTKNGTLSGFSDPKIQEKIRQSIFRNYGVSNISQLETVKAKKLATFSSHTEEWKELKLSERKTKSLEKYGVSTWTRKHFSSELLKEIENKFANISSVHDSIFTGIAVSTVYLLVNEFRPELISNTKSQAEIAHGKLLYELGIPYIASDRTIISPKELDIVIPDLKIAFEINGTYWHSTNFVSDKRYHQNKVLDAAKAGYKLIHLYEYQSLEEQQQIIRNAVLKGKTKYSARNSEVKIIANSEGIEFLKQYHRHGTTAAKVYFGLFIQGELKQVMSFGKSRFDETEWELLRMASKSGEIVRGGASKLFSAFIRYYDPSSIVCYSDLDNGINQTYEKLGFTESHISDPGYYWIGHGEKLSRYQTQVKSLRQKFSDFSGTEDSFMSSRGYLKVYNSGNQVFYWQKKT